MLAEGTNMPCLLKACLQLAEIKLGGGGGCLSKQHLASVTLRNHVDRCLLSAPINASFFTVLAIGFTD